VQISFISHRTILEKITFNADITRNFQMQHTTLSLDEVIVSGASQQTIVKESPVPIATFSRIQWLQSSSTNLVDAVAKMPGMSQISTGVALSKPVIRGLGFNRVITMHDGIRQEDNQWGEEHSIHIDEYSIDRYEIIRGAGSLMYGSDGLGGVMSVLSPPPVEEGAVRGSLLANYQTNNNLYGTSAMITGNLKGFTFLVRASQKNANNYRNALDGRVYGSNFREDLNLNGMIGLTRKWGYTRLYFVRWQQKINIINGTRDSLGRFTKDALLNNRDVLVPVPDEELTTRRISPSNSQDLSNYKISLNNLFFVGQGSVVVNYGYSQNHRKEFSNVLDESRPDPYFFLQTHFYDLRYNLPERNRLEVTVGTNGMYQVLQNRGRGALYPDFRLFDNGVFVFAKKSWNRLKLSGGLRHDVRQLGIRKLYADSTGKFFALPVENSEERFGGLNKNFSNLTGSLGGVFEINRQFSVKANLGRGFRSPAVPEIASNGEHVGTFRYEIGNLNQRPEVSLQTDFGLTFENKNIYFDLSLFQNRIQNYTYSERVQNGAGKDSVNSGVPVFRYTQGNARLQGLEASFTVHPQQARWFNFSQSLSVVSGRNLSAKNDSAQWLPFMPPPRWISRIRISRDKLGSRLNNVYALTEMEIHQRQNQFLSAYDTETATPGYFLFNAGLGGDICNRERKTLFSLYVSAQNLLDLVYQNHQNRLKYLDFNATNGQRGVFNIGRNVSVKLVVPIK
jgi:iron complex outermembrane recepter protein